MELIDNILINALQIIVPFAIYLFYVAYKNIDDDRENELAIILTIFSSMYIGLKFNTPIISSLPMIIMNIPLIMSYYKKNNIAIAMSSVVIIAYNYKFYDSFLLLLIFEYLLYYLIYRIFVKKFNINYFVIIFTGIKTIFMMGSLVMMKYHSIDRYLEAMLLGLIFALMALGIIYLLRKAEEILRVHRSVKEIEHDKQIRTMLFQITHEIKNPIAVCKGYLDMFDVNNPEHAKKYIPIMKDEVDRTLVLLEDFLSMNRVRLNKDILDINMLVSDVIENYDLLLKEHKVKVNNKISDEEVYIDGDYNKLMQVFVNIIKNSVEALEKNPVIEVKTEVKNKKVYIYFKDNGMGIPKDVLEKIKEPFFTTKSKGTGLGVSLSYGIIEAHGGKISYESEVGLYTLVTVILPLDESLNYWLK